jgi:hypothetical protein
MYSSLFKQSDVRITQGFKSTHKALDLSRGVARQPIYSPNKLGGGVVIKADTSYTDSSGKVWSNSLRVDIKYDNGMTSRHFHGEVRDRVVNVGERVVVGQQVYRTGNTGNSNGDHLHYVLVNASGTPIDPTAYVISDEVAMSTFKVGDSISIRQTQNIRQGAGNSFPVVGKTVVGEMWQIVGGPTSADGFVWWDCRHTGGAGWLADGGWFVKIEQEVKTELELAQEEINRLKASLSGVVLENDRLRVEKEKMGEEIVGLKIALQEEGKLKQAISEVIREIKPLITEE